VMPQAIEVTTQRKRTLASGCSYDGPLPS
jgi:hypothetical protein